MKVLVIVNPVSGGGRGTAMGERLCGELSARGASVEKFVTRRAGDARGHAGLPGFDCVAVVGGDGTVNEAANGLSSQETRLAILPLGTANVVAKELGIPSDPPAVADLIVRDSTRVVDAGRYGSRRFLLGVGAGPDAAVVEEVHRARGRSLSYASYVRPALRVLLGYRFPAIRVEIDGSAVCEDANYVVVGNCRYSAGVFPVTPLARIDDGLLDVCVVRNLSLLRLAALALATHRPGFSTRRGVMYAKGREIVLSSSDGRRVPFQVDGDPGGELPLSLCVETSAFRMVAPA
ncbi:MAG: diacylglycerol kinase family lipid kinase [Candidatus Hydrogenedentes bacterium]|nr:diacylglycerol kinase family lipid kinase [Candidatus Hydrogenedentota bacterium]